MRIVNYQVEDRVFLDTLSWEKSENSQRQIIHKHIRPLLICDNIATIIRECLYINVRKLSR